jgi:hypothetical protein
VSRAKPDRLKRARGADVDALICRRDGDADLTEADTEPALLSAVVRCKYQTSPTGELYGASVV